MLEARDSALHIVTKYCYVKQATLNLLFSSLRSVV